MIYTFTQCIYEMYNESPHRRPDSTSSHGQIRRRVIIIMILPTISLVRHISQYLFISIFYDRPCNNVISGLGTTVGV